MVCSIFEKDITELTKNVPREWTPFLCETSVVGAGWVSLSKQIFAINTEPDEPYYCPHCMLSNQINEIVNLKASIEAMAIKK